MKWFASATLLALFIAASAPARAQDNNPAPNPPRGRVVVVPAPTPAPPTPAGPVRTVSFTKILSGPNGPKSATKISIDTDTGYAGALGMLFMSDSAAIQGLPKELQEIDDNKEWAAFIALGEKTGKYDIAVTGITWNQAALVITYVVTPPAAAGDTTLTHPYVFVKFPRLDGLTTSKFVFREQTVETALPAVTHLPVTTVLAGSKGPDFATKSMIDTDTGYAGALGSLFMTDGDEVRALSTDLQQMDDNKDSAVFITLGKRQDASSVKVTDVSTDGSSITISYLAVPAAPGAASPAQPFALVRFPRQMGIPTSRWTFRDLTPAAAGAFSTLRFKENLSFPVETRTLDVDWNGKASLASQPALGEVTRASGQATDAELQAIRDGFLKANIAALDGKNVSPGRPVPDTTDFTVFATVGGAQKSFSGNELKIGPEGECAQPLVAALEALAKRLATPATQTITITGFAHHNPHKAPTIQQTGGPLYTVAAGPLEPLVDSLDGKAVTVKANVTGTSAQVLSVDATSNVAQKLLPSADPNATGSRDIPQGSTVQIVGVSPDGKFDQVQVSAGGPVFYRGWVPSSSLTVGGSFVPISKTPGVTGKMPQGDGQQR